MSPVFELELLYGGADYFHVVPLTENTKCQDKDRIRLIDSNHSVIAAFIDEHNVIAEHYFNSSFLSLRTIWHCIITNSCSELRNTGAIGDKRGANLPVKHSSV